MRGVTRALATGMVALVLLGALLPAASAGPARGDPSEAPRAVAPANATAVQNFSGALNRLVVLVAAAGGAVLALVWARVALSWFSNDVTKKIQAKDRARDALVGTLIFLAAVSGLAFALAQWVVSGT
jgi:hypothetical protein